MRKLPHYLEAALSFRSVTDLNKRYSKFFNSVTLGYECEVSKGALDGYNKEVSYEDMRREFESGFNYDHDTFLSGRFKGAKEIIETFDVEFMYGYAQPVYEKPIKDLLNQVNDEFSYKVMKFDNPETNEIEYVKPIINMRSSGWLEFVRSNKAEAYDLDYVVKVTEAYYNLIKKFIAKYKIEVLIIDYRLSSLEVYLEEVKDISIEDDEDKLVTIFYIGRDIDVINNQFKFLYNSMDGTDIYNSKVAVLDGSGRLVLLKMDDYEEGLLNPLVKDFDADKFDTEYENAKQDTYDGQFEDFRENYRTPEADDSEIINKIYECVLSDVDKQAKVSVDYHANAMNKYRGKVTIVESDSSISPAGAEIVSPVLTGLNNSFTWLDKVFDMIDNHSMETNRSTGLHVNIGTFRPLSKINDKYPANASLLMNPIIDVVKLAILSGDQYLLEQFDRLGNSYALSIASNIRDLAANNFDLKAYNKGFIFNNRKVTIQDCLEELNKKLIQNQSDRYRTINMQNLLEKGYIEFRIAGGEDYHANKDKVNKAVYRYAQLCAIACDPQAYFKEYMTELYRLFVDNTNPADIQIEKPPRPKNVQEAMYIVRAWSSKYMENGHGALPAAPKDRIRDAIAKGQSAFESDILDMIAGIDTKLYPKVDANFLYAIRLLMLYSAKDKPNPKKHLIDTWNMYKDTSIKNYLAPKMYRNKPQWLKFFFTGTMSNSDMPKGG